MTYEPETTRIFNAVLKEGDSVLIAGAHHGYFTTIAAALVGPTGKVFAFEPHDGNRGILAEKVEPFGNVKVYPYALGNQEKKAILFCNADNDGGHSLYDVGKNSDNVKTRENPAVQNVEVKTIDGLFEDEDMSKLRLCLFDVEGAELSVLKGAINTLVDNDVPYIICEVNNFALAQCGTSQATMRAFMDMYGYRCYRLTPEGCEDMPNKSVEIKAGEQSIVFNVLFSLRGKI